MAEAIPAWLRPGAKYRNGRGRLFHVRGVVDDVVVVRTWWASKKRWNYTCESLFLFTDPELAQFYKPVSR